MTDDERATGGELPNEAFVVRAGIMELKDLIENVNNHYIKTLAEEEREEWAMSVYCLPNESVDEIARRARKRNRRMCISTVGDVRAVGCEVRSDWVEDGHSNVMFDGRPTDEDLLKLKSVFSEPIRNPHPIT